MALYYYTNGRPASEVNAGSTKRITTTFGARKGKDSGKMKVFNTIVNVANDFCPPIIIKALKRKRKK